MQRTLTSLTLVLAVSAGAEARERDGWYGSLFAGYNNVSDTDITDASGEFSGAAEFSGSFAGGGAVGYDFGDWRLEGEILYRSADLDSLETSGGTLGEGDFASLGIGANALYGFNLFGSDQARSYVGAGLVWIQEIDIDFELDGEQSFSGDDVGWQLILGVEYDLGPRWGGFLEYRYLDAGDPDLDAEGAFGGPVSAGYENNAILAGLRFEF